MLMIVQAALLVKLNSMLHGQTEIKKKIMSTRKEFGKILPYWKKKKAKVENPPMNGQQRQCQARPKLLNACLQRLHVI